LIASRKKDQDLHATAQQKCHEATQKLEAQNAELNGENPFFGVAVRSFNVGSAND